MSCIEHLIENALTALEDGMDYEQFCASLANFNMFIQVNATPEEIWEIANYIQYTYCQHCPRKEKT